MTLAALLNELKEKLPMMDSQNDAVSKAPVGWHIQHSLMVINTIIRSLEASDEMNYKWKFSFWRSLIFAIGKFPRGRVNSPKSVRPKEDFNLEILERDFETTENNLKKLAALPKNAFFTHPIFGDLNLKPATTFLKLHTVHHLKIIRDIIA